MREKPCRICEQWNSKMGTEYCMLDKPGFPFVGTACKKFRREPGSDDDKGERDA